MNTKTTKPFFLSLLHRRRHAHLLDQGQHVLLEGDGRVLEEPDDDELRREQRDQPRLVDGAPAGHE